MYILNFHQQGCVKSFKFCPSSSIKAQLYFVFVVFFFFPLSLGLQRTQLPATSHQRHYRGLFFDFLLPGVTICPMDHWPLARFLSKDSI